MNPKLDIFCRPLPSKKPLSDEEWEKQRILRWETENAPLKWVFIGREWLEIKSLLPVIKCMQEKTGKECTKCKDRRKCASFLSELKYNNKRVKK